MQLQRHFHDENGVLGRQRDQENDADLGVEVVLDAQGRQHRHRAKQRQRHRKDHRNRRVPALVLAGEHEIDQQQRQREREVDLTADHLLLIGHRSPLKAGAARQRLVGNLLHQLHRLAGAVAGGGQADDGRGRVEIVEADQRRADRGRDLRHRPDRDHVAVRVAHHQVLDVARGDAELRVGLGVDLEGAAELVELVDVGGAHIGRQRGEDLVRGDVQDLGLDPVDLDVVLRHRRAERRGDALQRALRLGIRYDGAGDRLQLGEIGAAVTQLDLHGKACGIADALNGRRRDHQDARL